MGYGDDLDARFEELVAQFSEEERRRMQVAAAKAVRRAQGRRSWRRLVLPAICLVVAVAVAAAAVVAASPQPLAPAVQTGTGQHP
ncbi:hypothetical protein [Thermoactinospora rubra]|uniref:hypothetical protein n=1 Tax=Thermoactinospora rubra TaxID=1088767 RepID=UPI00117E337A|nr:hypothetical protein [Thermoactinospora rubra]